MIISERALAVYETNRQQIERRWSALVPPAPPLPVPVDPTAIVLGTSNGNPISLPLRVRQQHTLILGSTSAGKSRFNFLYIIEAIRRGEGVIFLDPHASHPDSTAKAVLEWLDRGGYFGKRRITYLDFTSKANIIAFNPLALPSDTHPSVVVHKVMQAASIIWAEEETARTPTIERVFSISLYALIDLGLTLAELPALLDREDRWGLRRHALQVIPDPYIRHELERVHQLSRDGRRVRDYDNDIIGPLNRLRRLLFCEAIRTSLGQTGATFDARAAMDGGEIVIADVSGNNLVSEEDADLYGRLLVREFLFHAKRRTNLRPFNLVIDEASRVFSSDLPTALAELRKYSVSILASMQWLYQAEHYDESILKALLNGCGTKIIFRLPDADDSELLARSVVPIDLEKPVGILTKPTVVAHRIRKMLNESDSTNQSVTHSQSVAHGETWGHATTVAETDAHTDAVSEGVSEMSSHSSMRGVMDGTMSGVSAATMSGSAESVGQTVYVGDLVNPDFTTNKESHGHGSHEGSAAGSSSGKSHGRSSSSGDSYGTSRSTVHTSADTHATTYAETDTYARSVVHTQGEAHTQGTGHSQGFSEGLEPILEDRPTSVHSLSNMIHMAAERLRTLKTGTAFINFMGADGMVAALFSVTPMLTPKINQDNFPALRDRIMAQGNGALPMADAVKAIEARHQHLKETLPPKTIPAAPKAANKNTKQPKEPEVKKPPRLRNKQW